MVDITYKANSLRTAIAQSIVLTSSKQTIEAIKNKTVPKGDVFEVSRTAGLFAAKRTSDMIPDCHPLPIEFASVSFEINELQIIIKTEIHTIYKTGVEVEAMHAASVVALTIYDMLKPIDKGIEIHNIKLISKNGGKSDFNDQTNQPLTAAVIVCSDSISSGKKEDKAGKVIIQKLEKFSIQNHDYVIVPDEISIIKDKVQHYVTKGVNMVIITGGTGLSKRDLTPEAIKPMLDREIPGIAEAIRTYGQQRTPYAMLSRSISGLIGKTLVLALPGSTKGAGESMDAVFPALKHIFKVMEGARHD